MNVFDQFLRLFRPADSRRRRGARIPLASLQALESRCLLSAQVIRPIEPVATATPETQSFTLDEHFDDTSVTGTTVLVQTPFGDVPIETFDEVTPVTVQNFLSLIDGGNYDSSFLHRSVPGFVVQGGGFRWPVDGSVQPVEHNGTIPNEFDNWFDPNLGGLESGTPLNVRGTLAKAKLGGDPDSATSQWFVNLGDNSANLDTQNGGFTVFAQVLYDGLDVFDAIAALPRVNAQGAFTELPVRDFEAGNTIQRENVLTYETLRVEELSYDLENLSPELATAEIVDGQLVITPNANAEGTIEVRVTATDLGGNSVEQTVQYTIGAPRDITGLSVDATNQVRPTFTWDNLPEASSYQVWINHVGVQNALILEDVTSPSFQPDVDLEPGTYRLWVRPSNASGVGEWSSPIDHSFGLNSTTIISPSSDATVGARPTIEWEAVDGAVEYDLWINHVGVENQVIRETVTGTSFTAPEDLASGTYRAWVQVRGENQTAAWSAAVTFEVQAGIAILAPTDIVTNGLPEFVWTGDAGQTYELWVNQIGGQNRIIHDTTVQGTSLTATTELAAGDYRAWVRLRPSSGPAGPWSQPFDLTVAASSSVGTAVIESVTGTDNGLPLIVWQDVANAVRFELWVNQDGGPVRIIHETQLTGLSFQATDVLPAGNYRAWVRGFDANDNAGAWSDPFTFEV